MPLTNPGAATRCHVDTSHSRPGAEGTWWIHYWRARAPGKKGPRDRADLRGRRVRRQNIRVNAVCPGAVRTALLDQAIHAGVFTEPEAAALHPTGVLISPEDAAQAFLYLASDLSKHVTGHA
ncbi:SDR family oxidoreductase [Streptomyces sp. NPDC051135]|uniref:SDR family oxidoreductase n=1 Tax=unclassified Streptomyces TaxID=2593676 RepID=UPI003442CD7E